ncbi:MAG: 50S ribosomal protein L24 [Oligoflexia bacterium]|nr:50S ribosomal protein L24 [Oligoflexia bacterium]
MQNFGFPNYKKNDLVQVISGKHKGKKGKVLKMIKRKGLIIVEKVNVVKRHTKPSQKDPKGGIFEKEAPLHVCKVLPISAKTNKPVRVSVWLKEKEKKTKKKS